MSEVDVSEEGVLGHSRVFLLDFLFQDLGILSRISLKKNWSLKLSQKARVNE